MVVNPHFSLPNYSVCVDVFAVCVGVCVCAVTFIVAKISKHCS